MMLILKIEVYNKGNAISRAYKSHMLSYQIAFIKTLNKDSDNEDWINKKVTNNNNNVVFDDVWRDGLVVLLLLLLYYYLLSLLIFII